MLNLPALRPTLANRESGVLRMLPIRVIFPDRFPDDALAKLPLKSRKLPSRDTASPGGASPPGGASVEGGSGGSDIATRM